MSYEPVNITNCTFNYTSNCTEFIRSALSCVRTENPASPFLSAPLMGTSSSIDRSHTARFSTRHCAQYTVIVF